MSEHIPKIIHKVLLLNEGAFEISKKTLEYHQLWLDKNPGYRLMYWDFQKCRVFLAKIDSNLLTTFDSIVPYSGKVDFFRYCVIFYIGGWYSDWNQVPLCSISDMIGVHTDKQFYYFNDHGLDYTIQMKYAQTCFIGGVPNNIVMRDAVNVCAHHVKNEVYGNLPIDSTACGVITKAIHRNPEVSSSLGYFTRVNSQECEAGLPVLISRSLNKVAIIHKICKTRHDENTWTNGNNYTAHWRTKTYFKSSIKPVRDKSHFEDAPSETERVVVSLYAGEGLYFALRDELLSLSTEDAPPNVLITYYDPDSYVDRWRLHLMTKLTKAVHFNGNSEGSFSKLPYRASKELIRPLPLVADAFDETRDGSFDHIGDSVRAAMGLKYEPTEILFLMQKGRVLDSLTGKPVEGLLDQLSIHYLYPEESSMELLVDRLRRTACLIAVHGDYLANMVLVSPSCSVLEISLEEGEEALRNDACWHNMARGLGLRYEELPCDRVAEEGVHIDIPMILTVIREKALARSNLD
jgi:hypothetical protein